MESAPGTLIGKTVGGTTGGVADPPQSSASAPASLPPAGTKVASGISTVAGSRMRVRVTPAASRVRVNAPVAGIPVGEQCRLLVEGGDGRREIAGSWVVGDTGKGAKPRRIGGRPTDDVPRIVVENDKGKEKEYVSLKV